MLKQLFLEKKIHGRFLYSEASPPPVPCLLHYGTLRVGNASLTLSLFLKVVIEVIHI